jgi:predicted AlkP superfamily phosphohydrolase/phosphomutase
MRRVMLIGLDCVPPALAFERYRARMPCLDRLMSNGAYGQLRSTFPPITVPAWTSMVSGRDPGELGLYGFRQRAVSRYELSLVNASDVRVPRVWDVLADHDKASCVLFVPPSYPPFPIKGGAQVSCFLTPDDATRTTYPQQLSGELEARFGRYIPDVMIRGVDRSTLLDELEAMTRQHFAMAGYLWQSREPDFMMMVEIGPDRLHHAFLGTDDEACGRYYEMLDRELSDLVALADDDTSLLIASDHGARPLTSVFRINEWLLREGYLVLRADAQLAGGVALRAELIDFARTRAWAEGGYYARVMLNVAEREPQGIVPATAYEDLRSELRAKLSAVTGPHGAAWRNRIETPQALYREVRGLAPDLLAVFDDLAVRPIATVGTGELHGLHDDRGHDGANHDWLGIFVASGPGVTARGELTNCEIYDVGATVLGLFDVAQPAGFRGRDRSRS